MIRDRSGADGREAEVVVWLVEGRTSNADRGQSIDRLRQLDLVCHSQHDEVTTVIGLKAVARFKTSVTNLHDLIGQGQIGANKRVAVTWRSLLLGHSARPQFARVSTGTV